MIGTQLENAGWRQGAVVTTSDHQHLCSELDIPFEEGLILLLASQSCDIANNNIPSDPYIELSVARPIVNTNGNLTYNKNPRILHTHITCRADNDDIFTEDSIELKAFEKLTIPKATFATLHPDSNRVLEDSQLTSYVAWLAARYSRPALPSVFNNRLCLADPKNRLRNRAKKGNEQLVGIYVELMPDEEIKEDEIYVVNLLGLLPAGFTGDTSNANTTINAYAKVLEEAGMNVTSLVRKEDEITIAVIKRFKRFYFDDLSFREDTPLPPETKIII